MAFSYGFIDEHTMLANSILLDLDLPKDDPLGEAKQVIANAVPSCLISEKNGHIEWESDFIWLICVNEEDGLRIGVQQTLLGEKELMAFWKEEELVEVSALKDILQRDPKSELYKLRAVCILQDRVRLQLARLNESGTLFKEEQRGIDANKANDPESAQKTDKNKSWAVAQQLRSLEMTLLEEADSFLDKQVSALSYPSAFAQLAASECFPYI